MAIKELITLEGVENVERSLKQLGTSGEAALDQFRRLGSETQDPFSPLADSAQKAGQAINDFGNHTFKLSEIFHVLRPALQAAGVQIGEFGSLARIAGIGVGGLAVALTGAIIVGFARLEESIAATKGRLADLFGSQAAAETAFAQLNAGIKGIGATLSGLTPALEAAKTALDRYIATTRSFKFVSLPGVELPAGTAQNLKNVGDAVLNFFKILRAGRLDATEAEKADKAFFDTLKEGGNVTSDALKKLPTGTVQLLAEAMGRGRISAEQFITEVSLAPIPVTKLIEALARFGPQADQAFNALAIKGFGDAFNEMLKSLQEGFRTISGTTFSNAVIAFLDRVRGGIDATKREIDLLVESWRAFKALFPELPQIVGGTENVPLPLPRPSAAPPKGFIVPPPDTKSISDAVDKIDQEVTPQVDALGKKWANELFGPEWADALEKGKDETLTTLEGLSNAPLNTDAIVQSWNAAMQAFVNLAQQTFSQIQSIFSSPINVNLGFGNQPQGAPFASGGIVRGPGTGTSDSILAWLSDKEFVINARAVSHYGPELFAALNAMRLPRDFLSRFNLGGLVRAIAGSIPHFAQGGMVASSAATAPVTFVIDRQSFDVRASDQTIARLRRYAVASQLSSTGRKPSWVK